MTETPKIEPYDIFSPRGNLKLQEEKENLYKLREATQLTEFENLFDSTCYKAQSLIELWSRLKSGQESYSKRLVELKGKLYVDKTLNENETLRVVVDKNHTQVNKFIRKAKQKTVADLTISDFGLLIVNNKFMGKRTRKKIDVNLAKKKVLVNDSTDDLEFCLIVAADNTLVEDFITQLSKHVEVDHGELQKEYYIWHRSFSIFPKKVAELQRDPIRGQTEFNKVLEGYKSFVRCFDRRWIFLKDFQSPKVLKSAFCWFELSIIAEKDCFLTEFLDVSSHIVPYIYSICDPYEHFYYNDDINKIYPILTRIHTTDPLALKDSFEDLIPFIHEYFAKGKNGFSTFLEKVETLFINLIGVTFINPYARDLIGKFNDQVTEEADYSYMDHLGQLGLFLRRLRKVAMSVDLFNAVTEEVLEFSYLKTELYSPKRKDRISKRYCTFLSRKARSFLELYNISKAQAHLKYVQDIMDKLIAHIKEFKYHEDEKVDIALLKHLLQADIYFVISEIKSDRESAEKAIKFLIAADGKLIEMQNVKYLISQTILDTKRSKGFTSFLSAISNTSFRIDNEILSTSSMKSLIRLRTEIAIKITKIMVSLEEYRQAQSYISICVEQLCMYGFKNSAFLAQAFELSGDCKLLTSEHILAALSYLKTFNIYSKLYGNCNILTKTICDKILKCNEKVRVVDAYYYENLIQEYEKHFPSASTNSTNDRQNILNL